MSQPLLFARDGRTLPFVPVTTAATTAVRDYFDGDRRRQRPYALALYLTLLELCNAERGDRVALGRKTLAAEAGCSPSMVTNLLPGLVEAGVLEINERIHANLQLEHEYVAVEPSPPTVWHTPSSPSPTTPCEAGLPHDERGDQEQKPPHPSTTAGVETSSDGAQIANPSLLPSVLEGVAALEGGNAVRRIKLRFRSKDATVGQSCAALAGLAEFNRVFGTAYQPFMRDGRQTSAMTQVLGQVIAHGLDEAQARRLVELASRDRWWKGVASVGVVFGPTVTETLMQRGRQELMAGQIDARQRELLTMVK